MATIRRIEAAARQEHLRQQAAYELYWRNRIFIALRKQKKPLLQSIKANGLLTAYVGVELLIKPDELQKVLTRLYEGIVPVEAEKAYKQYLQQKAGFGYSQEWMNSLKEWLNTFLYDMIRRITYTTKKTILAIIAKGIEAGDSYDDIIDQITATGFDRTRAATIARTETNRAMGWAKYDAISKLPYPADVVWIAARDKRTRGAEGDDKADHFHMMGQKVQYMQPFTDPRSGAQMLFPGDISMGAQAKDTVNCRCTIASRRRT